MDTMNEKKILVVDDEESLRKVYKKVFDHAGYNVRLAKSGAEALEHLKDDDIQVIYLDLKLPDMSGVELCRRVRKCRPAAVIYAVSGLILEDYREAGFNDYFTKPISIKTLLRSAENAFERA